MTTQTSPSPRYVTAAETAKLVRRSLKEAFPGQKFSVRSSSYAGGASIRIGWTDGPRAADVDAIAGQFAGGRFDGMIDLAYSVSHWLRPDGRVLLAHDPGTEGSRGSNPGTDNRDLAAVIPADAELVRFGADHVITQRVISDRTAKVEHATAWLLGYFATEGEGTHQRIGNRWVSDMAEMLAQHGDENRTHEDTARLIGILPPA